MVTGMTLDLNSVPYQNSPTPELHFSQEEQQAADRLIAELLHKKAIAPTINEPGEFVSFFSDKNLMGLTTLYSTYLISMLTLGMFTSKWKHSCPYRSSVKPILDDSYRSHQCIFCSRHQNPPPKVVKISLEGQTLEIFGHAIWKLPCPQKIHSPHQAIPLHHETNGLQHWWILGRFFPL